MEHLHRLLPRVSPQLFCCRSRTLYYIQMFRIPSREHALYSSKDSATYFFLGLRLLFRVISNMLCTCISQAVAHIHNRTFFSFHCILLHVYRSSASSRKLLMTIDPRSRSREDCHKAKESKWACYYPKTLPTLFFTTPVSICPPSPPIDQLEETTF
jgi:hypothetical protein